MLKILSILLFLSSLYSSSLKDLVHLSIQQQKVLIWVFKQGKKYNLEYTLTAIAWQESNFGKYRINLSDPSGGIFHNLTGSVCCRLHLKINSWNQSRILERLVNNNYFALDQAIQELLYWKDYWNIRSNRFIWSKMVGSYNGGNKFNKKYIKDIKWKIKLLKTYIKIKGIK